MMFLSSGVSVKGKRFCFGLILLAFLTTPIARGESVVYLDDMAGAFTATQGWGNLGIKTAAWGAATPRPLRIGEKEYTRGLGTHAAGEIILPLAGKYQRFEAEVGVQQQDGDRGSVVFEIWVDGEKRFDSGLMTDQDPAKAVTVSLEKAQQLRLAARDGGDGIICDMANWAEARLVRNEAVPGVGAPAYAFNGQNADSPMMEGSFSLIGNPTGQIAFSRPLHWATAALAPGGEAVIRLDLDGLSAPFTVEAEITPVAGKADIRLALASGDAVETPTPEGAVVLTVAGDGRAATDSLEFRVAAGALPAALRLTHLRFICKDQATDLDYLPTPPPAGSYPTPQALDPLPLLEKELILWDWRMQDGLGAGKTQTTFAEATEAVLTHGDARAADFAAQGGLSASVAVEWQAVHAAAAALRGKEADADSPAWEALWERAHAARRVMAFDNPLFDRGPLLFVKQAPGLFSHQLTQYYGRYARPGGGLYVLENPGRSMQVKALAADAFPSGSFMHPEVSYDGNRIWVAFCAVDTPPADTFKGEHGRFYHIYGMNADGSAVTALTDGAYDDFAPKELPNGEIVFISTRRGGMHRCGTPGCEVYTLTLMQPDGGKIHTISYHETQEWDPSVLHDGRLIYTRWDYVDRSAVHYQQLWWARPDGTTPSAFYGNNTLNPVGVWEPRAVPGSARVMATAAPHHGMTAGSILLVDPTRGANDLEPLTRLTPEVPFPESESVLAPGWRSALAPEPPARGAEMDRWPGQCFRSPYPLSEKYFFAAYSFDTLIGEPKNNPANIFGLYWVDAFGNKELIYRDLNIASLWPMPLRAREIPPVLPSALPAAADDTPKEGVYYVHNVYDSDPALPAGSVKGLRILQVLPKSTSGANNPTLGAANASPGKQVLGTVPVEADGSAAFRAPAGIALAFEAIDELGQAVQVMRSVTYLQPGETASCMGCHEPRLSAPKNGDYHTTAFRRTPSTITPGPDGSRPLSYPILVQPVLDKHCIRCHGGDQPKGPAGKDPIVLTGEPEGRYTRSYNTLIKRVSYSSWGQGKFPEGNCEPLSQPGYFGARGSALMKMLLAGHNEVKLDAEDIDRLTTWMDANALFYGTFNFDDQARQQRGERIAGPDLE